MFALEEKTKESLNLPLQEGDCSGSGSDTAHCCIVSPAPAPMWRVGVDMDSDMQPD